MTAAVTSDRRFPTIVLVSVTMLAAVGGWIAVGTVAYRQFFAQHFVYRTFTTNRLWRGEIVFQEQQMHLSGVAMGARIFLLNPQTGSVRPLHIPAPANLLTCVVDGPRLWLIGQNDILMTDGTTIAPYHTSIPQTNTAVPFLLDGKVTSITTDSEDVSQLVSLVDGQWQPGRRIVLPGSGRTWALDEEKNQERLVPRTTGPRPTTPVRGEFTYVVPIGEAVHVVTYDATGSYVAYRQGFDDVPEDPEAASALVPENAPADTAGWIRLDSRRFNWQTVPGVMQGEFVLATTAAPALWKLDSSDHPQVIRAEPQPDIQFQTISQVTSEDGSEFYLVDVSKFQNITVFRLAGDHFERKPIQLAGNADKVIAVEVMTVTLSVGILMLSHVLLLIGAAWLAARWRLNSYSFGHETVTLGPLARRWLARGLDLSCAVGPLLVVGISSLSALTPEALIEAQEFAVDHLHDPSRLARQLPAVSNPLTWASAWLVVFPILCVLLQGLTGATPGKWLCGLRVVRTTLRPCGLIRSLLRELLVIIDTLFLLTPIPGVMTILLTDQRRRLGDLTADTIVIDSRQVSSRPGTTPIAQCERILEGSAV